GTPLRVGPGNDAGGWGISRTGTGHGGDCPDTPGSGCLPSHGISTETVVLSCPTSRGVWQSGAGRGRVAGTCRSIGSSAQNWGGCLQGRTIPAQRGVAAVQSHKSRG